MALGDALLPDRADTEETGVTPVRTVQDLGPALRQARKALHLTPPLPGKMTPLHLNQLGA
jgi:hypothetical protein